MPFSVNDPFLFWLSGIVIAAVLAESVFFLVKAVRRARELKLSKGTIRKTILSSGLFSLAPAVSILIGVLTLNRFLGLPFPWLRAVRRSQRPEYSAAATIAANAVGAGVTETITSAQTFAVIAWTMTLGIIAGIVLILFGLKKLQKGMNSLGGKDEKWRGILMDALFLGMISAFLGLLFANVRDGVPGFIPIVVALVSALLMGVCGILIRVLKWTWLEQYALPLCMLGAMALSIPITALMA